MPPFLYPFVCQWTSDWLTLFEDFYSFIRESACAHMREKGERERERILNRLPAECRVLTWGL